MHRGRAYPQVLDRMLSGDATVPYFAPSRCRVQGFLDMFGVVPGPFVCNCGDAVVDYPSQSIQWVGTFTWGIYVPELTLTQQLLHEPDGGVQFLVVIRGPGPGHVSFRQIVTGVAWKWFPELGPYLWPQIALFFPYQNGQISRVEPTRYH